MSTPTTDAPTTTEPAAPPATQATTAPATPAAPQGDPAPAGDDGFKSPESKAAVLADLAREREEKRALKARLDEIERANLSELEKAQLAASEATEKLAGIERTALRQKVALATGLPAKWVDRLQGETEAEIAADAAAILADLADRAPQPPAVGVHVPGEGTGTGEGGPSIDAQIAEARKSGNHLLLIALEQQRAAEAAKA